MLSINDDKPDFPAFHRETANEVSIFQLTIAQDLFTGAGMVEILLESSMNREDGLVAHTRLMNS